MTGVFILLAVLVAATGFGVYRRKTDGTVRATAPETTDAPRISEDELGVSYGTAATLVEFSSAFCAPCRTARVVLSGIAAEHPGVVFVEIDAESHLELVRRLGVTRTPTVFILDEDGAIAHRAVGAPTKAAVLAALSPVLA